ncbi:DNA-binding IclR family transcriptional regulator [Streptomyces sp. CZ24]|nr:IclR family transcriptional regulator C-terminal domain-containing protein [Streptomyces sp. CZ24]MDH6190839.1 DNA-binding IclR family transcriptional regulator [Streptomyces sp. CZ24]
MGARAKDGPAPGTPSAHGGQPYDRPATDNSAPPRQGIQSVTRVTEIRTEPPREGVAATVGGAIPGVTPLAAPVFTAGDSLPLVVTLVMPSRGLTDTTLTELGEELRETARTMSEQLGFSGR